MPRRRTTDPLTPSSRLSRAVDSEFEALVRAMRTARRERAELMERLTDVEASIQALDERIILLARLRGSEVPAQADSETEAKLLRGPAIRATAVAVLRDHREGQGPIYYRRWLEILEEAGYEVGGRKPAATLLSQLTRSPVVKRTSSPGHYEIDRDAPARLRRRVEALRLELSAASGNNGEPVDLDAVRRRRELLVRKIERTERELAEATEALTLSVDHLSQSA